MSISRKPGQCLPPRSACRPSAGLCGSLWPRCGAWALEGGSLHLPPTDGSCLVAASPSQRDGECNFWKALRCRHICIGQCVCCRRPPQGVGVGVGSCCLPSPRVSRRGRQCHSPGGNPTTDLWCCQTGSVLCGQEEGSVTGANSDTGEKGCGHSEAHIKWREDLRLDSP